MGRLTTWKWMLLAALTSTGCSTNIFSPFDSPNGDAQILEYARGCLDNKDYACAMKYYQKLSSSYAEIQASEEAFTILNQYDANMATFAKAIGDGGGGTSLTTMATQMIKTSPSATKRNALYSAYIKVSDISSNVPLRGLVRMAAGLAMLGELLAEEGLKKNSSASAFSQALLADNATSCLTRGPVTCANAQCDLTGTSLMAVGAVNDYKTTPASTFPSTPTWGDFHGMLDAVSFAMSSELAASGSVGGGLGGFSSALLAAVGAYAATDANCYRWGLLTNDVGN
jgi:hypothetical protein